jgi:KH/beta-lactamase-domain protein
LTRNRQFGQSNEGVQRSARDIEKELRSHLPPSSSVSSIEFEGPFVVVYSKKPEVLIENGSIIKSLAKFLRKRIIWRWDTSVRKPPKEAERLIKNIVPAEAEISNVVFDETLGEVEIEAKKPGLVIGRNGTTLREITKEVAWRPTVARTPPINSTIAAGIRKILSSESAKRKRHLLDIGKRIHRVLLSNGGWVRCTFLGGASEVGRSSMLVETRHSKVLVDCGVNVGASNPGDVFPAFDMPELLISELDAIVISHAHLDHSGFVPFMFKYGYNGPVYCNTATRSLMTLLQKDYLDVAEGEGKLLPYSMKDIHESILHTIPRRYGEVTDLSPDIRLTMSPAGHILGSSIIHLHIGNGRYNMAIAHDFKFAKSRLLDPANPKFPRLEALIMESTYGAPRDVMPSRRESERQLVRIINQTVRRRGKVLIPSLAVGRAQELMIVLDRYLRTKQIEETPVYLDGMISEATAIHTCHPEYLSSELQDMIFNAGRNPFLSEWFVQVESSRAREEILNSDAPCVVMATSGMLTGGSSVEYFKNFAGDARNSIIFVSYQAERSLGKRVASGTKEIRLSNNGRQTILPVNMDVHQIEGFSGHSDRRELMNYVRKLNPKPNRVILVHGQRQKSLSLAQSISKRYRVETSVPYNLESVRFI